MLFHTIINIVVNIWIVGMDVFVYRIYKMY